MGETVTNEAKLRDFLKRATADLRTTRRRLEEVEERRSEPIAIVGMACRYPGRVASPQDLWRLVEEGGDGIGPFPTDRGWNLEGPYGSSADVAGAVEAQEGGFIADVADFDAGFFGISANEALAADPQQRLLLEASWHALEDAGVDPGSLGGTQAGVFVGAMDNYYVPQEGKLPEEIESYLATGGTVSVASGRIAYAMGLKGPAMTVDTACSSSLVTLHLAVQALRAGECSLALSGGATVIATPGVFRWMRVQGGLAGDRRCKSFAQAADGAGFSEGVGMLVLERLSDAQRNGHRIHALVRGSAVNQDGASNGLAAPNGPSQEWVIAEALENAGLSAEDVDAVEAHGTGTVLGDPIEAGALLATYGAARRDGPLRLGSIKSNIGHTQAASGVAGVIKMAMALREGVLPKTLHIDTPSSHVDWEAGEVELLTEAVPWEPNGHPRRAGVSSFGISGTNAHVIVEEAPVEEPAAPAEGEGAEPGPIALPGPILVPLSAKTEPAMREVAGRLARRLELDPELDPADLAYSLATTRSAFSERAVILGEEREQVLASLAALADGREAPAVARGFAPSLRRPVFLFPGQGSQHPRMVLELLESSPVFAAHIGECEDALSPFVDWSLTEVLADPQGEWLKRVEVVQPALFAVMVSLARLWRHFGVIPAVVAGHSQGEIAAAHVAGGLSLAEAARLAALRSQIIAKIAGRGGMLSVLAPAREVSTHLEAFGESVSVAAVNGPASLVLSGDHEALGELSGAFEGKGLRARSVAVDYAAHSAQIDELREEMLESFADLSPQSGQIPLHSTVTGGPIDTASMDAEYWYSNLRQTVLFEPVTRGLLEAGHRVMIEISPHPVFALALAETVEDTLTDPKQASVLETLRREEGGPERFALSLAGAHATGVALDWEALFEGRAPKRVPLPTYPFQRQRYWMAASAGTLDAAALGLTELEHPLLGAEIADPEGEGFVLTGRISTEAQPWLKDHAAAGAVLLPGTAFVELCLQAAERSGAAGLAELTLQTPLILPDRGSVAIQVKVGEPDEQSGERVISIYSHPQGRPQEEEGPQWVTHATGTLSGGEQAKAPSALPGPWPPEGAQPIALDGLYDRLDDIGLQYGPAFQGLSAAYRDGEAIYAEISLAPEQHEAAQAFAIHPALLDAAFHAGVLAALEAGEESLRLPFSWRDVSLRSPGAAELRARISTNGDGEEICLEAFDAQGVEVARVGSLIARPVSPEALQGARSGDGLLTISWSEVTPAAEPAPSIAVLAGPELEGAARHGSAADLSAAIETGAEPPATVLFRPTRPEGTLPEAALGACQDVLALVQQWIADPDLSSCRLVLLTENAMATADSESPDPAQAALWGLLRSAQAEHPGRFALLDTDGTGDSLEALPAALGLAEEPQLALREGRALVPRATRIPASQPEHDPAPALDPEKTVLISGGTGALASHVARHLVEAHGAGHLLLTSRQGGDATGAAELKAELGALGAEVRLAACDVSDADGVKALLAEIPEAHPLGAVIHAAATLRDGTLDHLDAEGMAEVFAPKACGAFNLHEATKGAELSDFVLFSSAAGIVGSPGQANYAAANVFCDALAQLRCSEGLPGTSIAWGAWLQESGLTADLGEADVARMRRGGIEPLSDRQGLDLFDRALAAEQPLCVAMGLNRPALRTLVTAGVLPPILQGLVTVSSQRESAAAAALATKLAALPEGEREGYLLEVVRGEVAAVLGHPSGAAVDPDMAFKDMGFDSLAAVELRNRLNAVTGVNLPVTAVFDYPNPARLAESVLAKMQPAAGGEEAGGKAIEAEFARLESLLSGLESDEQRGHAAALLRKLPGALRVEQAEGDLEGATDDEMFAVLEDELGGV